MSLFFTVWKWGLFKENNMLLQTYLINAYSVLAFFKIRSVFKAQQHNYDGAFLRK